MTLLEINHQLNILIECAKQLFPTNEWAIAIGVIHECDLMHAHTVCNREKNTLVFDDIAKSLHSPTTQTLFVPDEKPN